PARNWLQICQKIAVRQNHAARLSGCSRSENNLRDVLASDGLICQRLVKRLVCLPRSALFRVNVRLPNRVSQIFQYKPRYGGIQPRLLARRENNFDARIPRHTFCKVGGRTAIHGDCNGPTQQASPESCHPLRAIRPPNQYAIARAYAPLLQLQSASNRHSREFAVGPRLAAISASLHARDIAAVALKFLE